MKKNKPKNKVVTQMDLIKTRTDAIECAMAMFFITLHDKEGYGIKRLKRLWGEIETLSEDVKNGVVKPKDIIEVLRDEMGIQFR